MPKLPADLPENWTQGQTISPNGTETGLTEQHGYNYLMKQVNNTQTEVNGINEALPDVAQQATVEEINNKIGTESDADTQPTLFGRLAQMKNVLVEKLAEVLTKVTGIDGKIGTNVDTKEDGTLFGNTNFLIEYTKENTSPIFDTVRLKKELVKTTVPIDSSGTHVAEFKFSDGKKKIQKMFYKGPMTKSGNVTIEIDGTEHVYTVGSADAYECILRERLPYQSDIRYIDLKNSNYELSTNFNQLRCIVNNSFSVKIPVAASSSSENYAYMYIYYEGE